MKMNTEFISKTLCFHGQPLQKIWAGERGDHDLYQLGISNPDFSVYLERQKNLTFQDRAKRLKLHQFLARKASDLFDRGLQSSAGGNTKAETNGTNRQDVTEIIVSMPPYEYFLNSAAQDKTKVLHCALEAIKPGNIVYGVVTKPNTNGPQVKVLCTGEPLVRYLADINMRAILPNAYMIPGHDKRGHPKNYVTNDFVCCEVLDISIDAERMTLGMKGVLCKDTKAPLGLISAEQIPDYYRRIHSESDETFQDYLKASKVFNNENSYQMLYESVGLDINEVHSHMKSLKHRFASQDYAIELRQTQASKWAFRSVADGIEHFKIGRHVEAFQCLNKALNIDPRNVEGLVARGALYANKGSFIKAVEDFETALKLNAFHTNARKYMGETLVALGRSYEEENLIDEAVKAYQNCLNIIPNHEQARISLDALKRRPGQMNPVIDINLLSIPGSSDLKKKKKTKHQSPSSPTPSSDDSSESSTESDSSDDSSNSDSEVERHKKKLRKQKSLSPLSKRMGDMNGGNVGSGFEFSQPFHLIQREAKTDYNKMDDFLGAGDDDYQTRVQKLLEEASKHRKQRDGKSAMSKKKLKKKRKKAKKEAARLEKKSKHEASSFGNPYMAPSEVDLTESLEKYERSIKELNTYPEKPNVNIADNDVIFVDNEEPPPAPSFSIRSISKVTPRKRESPQPKPPSLSMRSQLPTERPPMAQMPSLTGPFGRSALSTYASASSLTSAPAAPFKPFPIKGPVVLDKFGCFRLVAPPPEEVKALARRSRSRSRSRSLGRRRRDLRRRSRSLGRRDRRRRSNSRSRRRSPSRGRRRSPMRARRSRSRLNRRPLRDRRTRSRSRSKGLRSGSPVRRRPPSPFNPNRKPRSKSPVKRRSKSPERGERKGRYYNSSQKPFGNRVWQRPAGEGRSSRSTSKSPRDGIGDNLSTNAAHPGSSAANASTDGRWKHDKFVKEDGISLEEIDKIITQAKKERKEEILQRDKKILKKNANNF